MLLELKSYEESNNGKATISRFEVDGNYLAYALEDRVRETEFHPPQTLEVWVEGWKIKKETAIPSGRYDVILDKSERFSLNASNKAGRPIEFWTPHVSGVPGFQGIRIHVGNTDVDTEGCPVLGLSHETGQDFIGHSRDAFDLFMPMIEKALGLVRVPGGPETWVPGQKAQLGDEIWHYELDPSANPQAVALVVDRTGLGNFPRADG